MNEIEAIATAFEAPPGWADKLYEFVDGKFVVPTPMGVFESSIANKLFAAIQRHFEQTVPSGWLFFETLFLIIRKPKRQRRPDVAYVSFERWPSDRAIPETAAWDVVPDLAVEVVSPGNTAIEILVKLDDYFRAGVRRVWIIYPKQQIVQDYTSQTRVEFLGIDDTLKGGDVVTGFSITLANLFNAKAKTAP